MPGKAFAASLGQGAFPLVPTRIHQQLKASLCDNLKTLYTHVGSPIPATEKREHGDIEIVVCEPHGEVTHVQVQEALGAKLKAAPDDGIRFSNYAVPTSTNDKYIQVNVQVCDSKDEWDAALFVHNYGDMGLIVGLLARTYGMTFGQKGLKTHSSQSDATHPSAFVISTSVSDILRFFGLSASALDRGFKSSNELFGWIQTSKFFVPRVILETADVVHVKHIEKRITYQAFLAYTRAVSTSGSAASRHAIKPAVVIQDALVFFGKKAEYEEIVQKNVTRIAYRNKLTGRLVMNWTGLNGEIVGDIMRAVKTKIGDAGIVSSEMDDIMKVTKEVQKELNAYPQSKQ